MGVEATEGRMAADTVGFGPRPGDKFSARTERASRTDRLASRLRDRFERSGRGASAARRDLNAGLETARSRDAVLGRIERELERVADLSRRARSVAVERADADGGGALLTDAERSLYDREFDASLESLEDAVTDLGGEGEGGAFANAVFRSVFGDEFALPEAEVAEAVRGLRGVDYAGSSAAGTIDDVLGAVRTARGELAAFETDVTQTLGPEARVGGELPRVTTAEAVALAEQVRDRGISLDPERSRRLHEFDLERAFNALAG